MRHSRLKNITYPNGRIVRYEYSTGLDDTLSRLSFLADDSSGSVGTHLEEYTYLGLSGVVKRAHPEPGVDLTYIKQSGESNGDAGDQYTGLDRFGRVVDQRWIITSSGSHTDRFQYGYDRDSNRLYKNNTVASAQSELYHSNGSGSYDNLNRLTDFRRGTLSASGSTLDTVTTASHTQSWTLDALGNMPSVNTDGTAVSRTHDDGNEITEIGSTSITYEYSNLSNDGTQSYFYDVNNHLTTVMNAAGSSTIASYAYDALGRRITESPTGSAATEVYYSANWQALEDDQSSHAKNQYVWSPVYIDALIERDRDADNDGSHTLEERLYAQQDANFNLTAILNTSGSVQERYLFDPYGSRTVTDSSFTARSGNVSSYDWSYGFQSGKYVSAALTYFRYRDLSTTIQRWLQVDPAQYVDGLNPFEFERTHPTSGLDPLGLGVNDHPIGSGTSTDDDAWVSGTILVSTDADPCKCKVHMYYRKHLGVEVTSGLSPDGNAIDKIIKTLLPKIIPGSATKIVEQLAGTVSLQGQTSTAWRVTEAWTETYALDPTSGKPVPPPTYSDHKVTYEARGGQDDNGQIGPPSDPKQVKDMLDKIQKAMKSL